MGCVPSKKQSSSEKRDQVEFSIKQWHSNKPLTKEQLESKRAEFWDTQPYYGGNKVVWDTLKVIAESDHEMKKVLIDSAGLIVGSSDLTVLYDQTGVKYELPRYVLSDPTNLKQ